MADPRIAIIGDSLTYMGGNGETFVREALGTAGVPDGSLYFYGVIGKRTTSADSEGKTTAQNIAEARAQLGQVDRWVIALGTNDRNSDVPYVRSTIQAVLSTIGAEPVIWIGLSSKGAATAADIATNTVIQEELRPGDTYADWDTYIRGIDGGANPSPYWNTGDATHMPPAGYTERAQFYAEQVRATLALATSSAYVGTKRVAAAYVGAKRVNLGGEETTPNDPTPITAGSTWSYYTQEAAPGSDWKAPSFNDSSWPTGQAPIGYGALDLSTEFTPPATRPLAVYFRRSFTIANSSTVASLSLTTRADDGVVVYVNGTEVGRQNMPTGTVGHGTYATQGPAQPTPASFAVPTGLLVTGENLITAETHLNYRSTPTVSFELQADLVAD